MNYPASAQRYPVSVRIRTAKITWILSYTQRWAGKACCETTWKVSDARDDRTRTSTWCLVVPALECAERSRLLITHRRYTGRQRSGRTHGGVNDEKPLMWIRRRGFGAKSRSGLHGI
jgi:hypothetical protein